MNQVGPLMQKLMWIAFALYVMGVCYIHCDLYRRLGRIEHILAHQEFNEEMKHKHGK